MSKLGTFPTAEDYAKRMIRARLNENQGAITAQTCLELMLEFAKFQSDRADIMEKAARDALNCSLPRTIIVERTPADSEEK